MTDPLWGVGRAGVVLRCTILPGDDGGPGEMAVVEPEAPVAAPPTPGAAGRRRDIGGG